MRSAHRLRYCKEGPARFISHLDLMRTLQRSFLRAGIRIQHTEGFNPHAFLSIPVPLPVGQSSECELLDFQLEEGCSLEQVPQRLNAVLPAGLRALEAYEVQRPFKQFAWLRICCSFQYDKGVPEGAAKAVEELFAKESLPVIKKTKRKEEAVVDLAPLIRSFAWVEQGEKCLVFQAEFCAQNPSLNPALLLKALEETAPEYRPDFARFRRLESLDAEGKTFR